MLPVIAGGLLVDLGILCKFLTKQLRMDCAEVTWATSDPQGDLKRLITACRCAENDNLADASWHRGRRWICPALVAQFWHHPHGSPGQWCHACEHPSHPLMSPTVQSVAPHGGHPPESQC